MPAHLEVRAQLSGFGSLLPSCGTRDGTQDCSPMLVPTKPHGNTVLKSSVRERTLTF